MIKNVIIFIFTYLTLKNKNKIFHPIADLCTIPDLLILVFSIVSRSKFCASLSRIFQPTNASHHVHTSVRQFLYVHMYLCSLGFSIEL